jgi:PKD repeat protein
VGVVTNTVTAPVPNQNVAPGANLNVIASGSSTTGNITGWEVFLDNTRVYSISTTSAPALNVNILIPTSTALGNHTITVKAYDGSGAHTDKPVTIVVANPVAGVVTLTVTSPASGASFAVNALINYAANATTTGGGITGWEIWFDSVRIYTLSGSGLSSISQNLSSPAGTVAGSHTILFKAWDNTGTLKMTSVPITITGAVVFSPGYPPSTKPVSSFSTHNVAMYSGYNQTNFPGLFTGTTNHDGVNIAVNPAFVDDSENAAAPMVISKETVRNYLALNPDGSSAFPGRIGMHYQAWWGLTSHPAIGMSDLNSTDVLRQVQDMYDRGYDLVIFDWNSPTVTTVCNDAIVDLFAAACNTVGLNFAIMIDQQYFAHNGYTTATYQSGIITGINHLMDRYASHPRYEHYTLAGSSRPLILLWNVASVAGANVDWTAVSAAVTSHANPLLIHYQASGFTVAKSDGSLAWLSSSADSSSDPSGSSYLTSSFFPACSAHPSQICLSSNWKGFNGTLTRSTSWSLGKYIDQRAGQTWLDVWQTNSAYISTGGRLDFICTITGDDFQEGSGVMCGIRTDVVVGLQMVGNNLIFTVTGNTKTVRRYNLWGSRDGVTATLLSTMLPGGATQFDLTALPGLTVSGLYTLYLEAQGMPSLQNHMAPQTPQRQFTLNAVPPAAHLASDSVGGIAPLTVNFDASLSVDNDNSISNYRFDFGDGATQSGTAAGAQHIYTNPGVYTCILTVTDTAGLTGTDQVQLSVTVVIAGPPPSQVDITPIVTVLVSQTVVVYEIPLSSVAQSFTITLNGVEYLFLVRWSTQTGPQGTWILDIKDTSSNPILSGIPLVTGTDLLAPYGHLNIGGAIEVQTDGDNKVIPTYDSLGKNSRMFFIVTQNG